MEDDLESSKLDCGWSEDVLAWEESWPLALVYGKGMLQALLAAPEWTSSGWTLMPRKISSSNLVYMVISWFKVDFDPANERSSRKAYMPLLIAKTEDWLSSWVQAKGALHQGNGIYHSSAISGEPGMWVFTIEPMVEGAEDEELHTEPFDYLKRAAESPNVSIWNIYEGD